MAVFSVILVGEASTYGGFYHYDADMDRDGNYSVRTSESNEFDVVLTDNGGFERVSEVYIYYDEGYGSKVNDALVEIGAKPLTQDYYISQLVNNLEYLSYDSVEIVGAAGLEKILKEPAAGRGVVMLSGAIPGNVYGESTALLDWIRAGGTLYWAGGLIGRYVGNPDGTVTEIEAGYQTRFVGSECLNPMENDEGKRRGMVFNDIHTNSYAFDLSLKNNFNLYSPDTTKLVPGTYLTVGYQEDEYATITFVKNGDGQICIMGGDYTNHQRMDLATVIAAGLCYCSEEVAHAHSSVTRSSESGKLILPESVAGHELCGFIYLGGHFSVYGETFAWKAV